MGDEDGRRATIASFLRARFPVVDRSERIELRCMRPGGGMDTFFARSVEEAAGQAVAWGLERNIYYGAALRWGTTGTAAGIAMIDATWSDVDDKHFTDRPDPPDAALAAAMAVIPGGPSLLVRTGHGWQPVWRLAEPTEDVARVERLGKRIALALGVDAVQDRARVLRLPGTMNVKDSPPVLAEAVLTDGPTYTLEELEAALPPLPDREAQQVTEGVLQHTGECSVAQMRHILAGISPTHPYALYSSLWSGVALYFPEADGLEMVDEWSSDAREANGQSCSPRTRPEKHYSFRRGVGSDRVVTLGTLIHQARLDTPGWEPLVEWGPILPKRRTLLDEQRRAEEAKLAERAVPALEAPPKADEFPAILGGLVALVQPLARGVGQEMVNQMAVAAWSALWGDKRLWTGMRLNLWALGVAPSGTGKSRLVDSLLEIVQMVPGCPPVLTEASPEGLVKKLEGDRQGAVVALDEWGDFIAGLGRRYMAGFSGLLCRLHDGREVRRVLASGEQVVTNPYLVKLALTTPEKFNTHMTTEEANGGLLNRLWVTTPDTLLDSSTLRFKLDRAAAQAWADRAARQIAALGKVGVARPYSERAPEVVRLERELGYGVGKPRSYREEVDSPTPAVGRTLARVLTVGALLELAEESPHVEGGVLVVGSEALGMAGRLLLPAIASGRALHSEIHQGVDERLMARMERLVDECGPEGATSRDVCRRLHCKAGDVKAIGRMLVESGTWLHGSLGENGRSVFIKAGYAVPFDFTPRAVGKAE